MTNELDASLGQLETQVIETIENPYSTYRVEFPYTCSFTIPDDGNITRVTIESRSEMVRYGRDEHDIKLQMELDQEHGKPTYAKYILNWVEDRIGSVDPREVDVSYGESHSIKPINNKDIQWFIEGFLENE